MRVIAGSAKGTTLKTPEGMRTRPTTDRVKEALFSILQFDLPGASVLDLFGGTGQLGIEALSRGASRAVFVDEQETACRLIREFSDVPIIMLTARTQDMDKLLGFEHGADDYLTKPFNILELKARIRALLRRSGGYETKHDRITVGAITVDTRERNVYKDGVAVDLTAREFDMVELLIRNPNRVYSRENLLDLIWGYEYRSDIRTVDVHIRRIREKLETVPASPEYIMTKWGVGYYFKA